MFHMKHLIVSAALTVPLAGAWTPIQAGGFAWTCIMVTDGSLKIYQHELAHCNGWYHPPFQINYDPPLEFVHRYNGPVTVIIGEGWDEWQTERYAQAGTQIITSPDSIASLCKSLWHKHNVNADMTLLAQGTRLSGCSVKGN